MVSRNALKCRFYNSEILRYKVENKKNICFYSVFKGIFVISHGFDFKRHKEELEKKNILCDKSQKLYCCQFYCRYMFDLMKSVKITTKHKY